MSLRHLNLTNLLNDDINDLHDNIKYYTNIILPNKQIRSKKIIKIIIDSFILFRNNKCLNAFIQYDYKYITQGSYALVYKINIHGFEAVLRISYTSYKYKINLNIEYYVYKLLYKQFQLYNFIHIPTLYDSFICNFNELSPLLQSIIYKNVIDEQSITFCRFTLMEYLPLGDLYTFITREIKNKKEVDFVNIYLQILIILYFLDTIIVNYSHNDLHVKNILVRKYNKILKYEFTKFNLALKSKYVLLLNDFDFSNVNNDLVSIINNKIYHNKNNINILSDLFKITNSLLCYFKLYIYKYKELYDLMRIIVPEEYTGKTVIKYNKTVVWYHGINHNNISINKIIPNDITIYKLITNKLFNKYIFIKQI